MSDDIKLSGHEDVMRKLLAEYEDALKTTRVDGISKVEEKKPKTDPPLPEKEAQLLLKPYFKEWLQLNYEQSQQHVTGNTGIQERIAQLKEYIRAMKIIKTMDTSNEALYCKAFAQWLQAEVGKLNAAAQPAAKPQSLSTVPDKQKSKN